MDFKSRRGCQIAKCAFAAVLGVTVFLAREWLLRTDFTPGFSETKFRSLEVGYPPRDVLTALGEPFSVAIHYLRKSENGENITDGSSMPLVLEGSKPFIHNRLFTTRKIQNLRWSSTTQRHTATATFSGLGRSFFVTGASLSLPLTIYGAIKSKNPSSKTGTAQVRWWRATSTGPMWMNCS